MNFDRESLLSALRRATDPRGLRPHELAALLNTDEKGRHRVRALLAELLDEGVVEKTEGTRYRPVGWVPTPPIALTPRPPAATGAEPKPGAIVGSIRVHPAGYGFVAREDGEEDAFVSAKNRGAALDGDRVVITTWAGYKGTEGRVVDVLARGRAKLTGTLRLAGHTIYLEPDDPRIHGHVSLEVSERAPRGTEHAGLGGKMLHEGLAVVAEIVQYPTEPEAPLIARVLHVLGSPDDPRTEVAKVIACADIPDEFPTEVIEASERAPTSVRVEDEIDRVDLRDRDFLTIDPETARDFDDAVCVEAEGPRPGIDRLWVAVADVSHYVRPGTALDREARVRGVSVYLPDRAISMLPHPLSAGICSLNPEVDRLAMVARIDVNSDGQVVEAQLQAAVIRSRARLDYAGVAAALSGDLRGPRARYQDHLVQLRRMQALSHRLRAVRTRRGSLDFDIPEAVVILDEDDPTRVRDVKKSRSLPEVREAYRMIEDFMLAANESVARYFKERALGTLWRIHAPPSLERLTEFASLAESFGIVFDPEEGRDPRRLRDFLATLKGKPMERSLSYLLLRALKQAVYAIDNVGHFGLAAPEYLHFTSPIRRYPDLVVHRLLKNQLRAEGMPSGGVRHETPPPPEELGRQAAESSSHERRAMEAEREIVDMYRTFLMRDRVGEEYDGTIVAVMQFGVFVEISEPFVEGLIKVEKLGQSDSADNDSYEYDAQRVRLVGRRSGRSFALGDQVRVRIENVSVPRRKIDLALVEHVETSPRLAPGERTPRSVGQRTPKRREQPAAGGPKRTPQRRAKPERGTPKGGGKKRGR